VLVKISKTPIRLLITGFGPFPGVARNTASLVLDELKRTGYGGKDVAYLNIPTEYKKGESAITRILSKYTPDWIIMLGVNAMSRFLLVEKTAVNFTHSPLPDDGGAIKMNEKVKKNGAAALWATIPIDELLAHLREKGFLCDVEASGGSYVCNHLFYIMLYELNRRGIGLGCGFIHLPPDDELNQDKGWPVELLCEGIRCCGNFLLEK